jgi:hypothetical protein
LVQKVNLCLMFQTIDLQNLSIFVHWEDLRFEFKVCNDLEKSSNRYGPRACGPRRPMTVCPGQRVCTHTATPWWLGHHLPPHARRYRSAATATCASALSFRRSSRRSTPRLYSHVLSIAITMPCVSPSRVAAVLLLGAECRRRLEPLRCAPSRRDCPSCATEPSPSRRTRDQSPKSSRRHPPRPRGHHIIDPTSPATIHHR